MERKVSNKLEHPLAVGITMPKANNAQAPQSIDARDKLRTARAGLKLKKASQAAEEHVVITGKDPATGQLTVQPVDSNQRLHRESLGALENNQMRRSGIKISNQAPLQIKAVDVMRSQQVGRGGFGAPVSAQSSPEADDGFELIDESDTIDLDMRGKMQPGSAGLGNLKDQKSNKAYESPVKLKLHGSVQAPVRISNLNMPPRQQSEVVEAYVGRSSNESEKSARGQNKAKSQIRSFFNTSSRQEQPAGQQTPVKQPPRARSKPALLGWFSQSAAEQPQPSKNSPQQNDSSIQGSIEKRFKNIGRGFMSFFGGVNAQSPSPDRNEPNVPDEQNFRLAATDQVGSTNRRIIMQHPARQNQQNSKAYEESGPGSGHHLRSGGTRRKTRKYGHLECNEREFERLWRGLRTKLDEIFDRRYAAKYDRMDPQDVVDIHLKPFVDQMLDMLLEEDRQMEGQQGSIGECMEFTISNSVFLEMEALAQSNQPNGMFTICLQFLLDLVTCIKSMPLIHNGNVHRTLLRICNCIYVSLKNDVYDVNDANEVNLQIGTILDFMETITQLSLNKDPEISKFFIEESTQKGRFRGTQTYLPVLVLLEFLKKEQVNQGANFKRRLREVIIKQLKIKNPKVRRFLVLESDFALNVLNKLQMYLHMLPEDVQLIRDTYEQYPDDDTQIYKGGLSLEAQLKSNCSQQQVHCFECFVDFLRTIARICRTASVSQVQYASNGKALVLLDQLCFSLFDYVLLGHFQQQILNERNLEVPGLLRTQMQLLLKIIETLQGECKPLMTLFYFIFGRSRQALAMAVQQQTDEQKAKKMFAQLDDDIEPEDDRLDSLRQVLGDAQDVSPQNASQKPIGRDGKPIDGLALQLSKLNFKAKNQASSLSIHDPYAAKLASQEVQENIQKEQQDRIQQLFSDLPLDEDEQAFLNSSRSNLFSRRGPSYDMSMMSARDIQAAMRGQGPNASFNLNDTMLGGGDQDLLNQTMMTNFDNELDEMDNQYSNHKQTQIATNFWRLTTLQDPKPALHCIDCNRQPAMHQFDAKRIRVEKVPTVNLLILDAFMAANLAEINEALLLSPIKPEDLQMDSESGSATGRSNLSMLYASQSSSGKVAGRVSESKYFQIISAQSKKLKSETNFKHIRRILNDLQEKYAEFSSNSHAQHQSQMGPRRSAFAQVRACTERLDAYVDKIEFRKQFGRQFSDGATACRELSHRELIEELESEEEVKARLGFLKDFEGVIIKDSDVLLTESRIRASVLTKQRMRNSMLDSPMLAPSDSFDYQQFKASQLRHETHAAVQGRPSRMLYQQDSELTSSGVSSTQLQQAPAHVERCYTIDRSLYLGFEDSDEFWSADGDHKKRNAKDDCDLASENSGNDTLAKQCEQGFNQINRKGRLQSLVQKDALAAAATKAGAQKTAQKSTSAESSVKEPKVFKYERPSSKMSGATKLDDHHSQFVKMLVKKTGDFFDNPLEENITVISLIEKVLSYDLDYSTTAYSAFYKAHGIPSATGQMITRERIYQVQKDVLLALMNTIQKCETDLLGRLTLDSTIDRLNKDAGYASNQSQSGLNRALHGKAMPNRVALVNRPEIYRYVLECLILQMPTSNLTTRAYHRKIIHSVAQLDQEMLQPLIPIFDKMNNQLTDFHQVTSACRELFRNKRKQLQSTAYLLAWAFGNVRAGMLTQVNKVKQSNALKDDSSGVARLKSTGLSAMLDAQQMAHQMQMAYEESFRLDQELEASLAFYQTM